MSKTYAQSAAGKRRRARAWKFGYAPDEFPALVKKGAAESKTEAKALAAALLAAEFDAEGASDR